MTDTEVLSLSTNKLTKRGRELAHRLLASGGRITLFKGKRIAIEVGKRIKVLVGYTSVVLDELEEKGITSKGTLTETAKKLLLNLGPSNKPPERL